MPLDLLLRDAAQRGGLASPSRHGAHGLAPRSSLFAAATREGTEHTLYRLLTLSNSLGALEVDVRRTFAALTALLGNDEDMATMYLSHKAMEGEQRPVAHQSRSPRRRTAAALPCFPNRLGAAAVRARTWGSRRSRRRAAQWMTSSWTRSADGRRRAVRHSAHAQLL